MKHYRSLVAFASMIAVVAALVEAQTTAAGVTQAPGSNVLITRTTYSPPEANDHVLTLGRQIYAELDDALSASKDHATTALRLALSDAKENLRNLYTGGNLSALHAQTEIIQHDLADTHKHPDAELWAPVRTELYRELLQVPSSQKEKLTKAAHDGQTAAAKGDRDAARQNLEILVDAMEYRFRAFPLRTVRQDIDAAIQAAFLPNPDWGASAEAIRSAQAELRWFTHGEAHGMLAAFDDINDAYYLWPEKQAQARHFLLEGSAELAQLPDQQGFAREIRTLAGTKHLQFADISDVLERLGQLINEHRESTAQSFKHEGTKNPS
jgi:hypothetical protein